MKFLDHDIKSVIDRKIQLGLEYASTTHMDEVVKIEDDIESLRMKIEQFSQLQNNTTIQYKEVNDNKLEKMQTYFILESNDHFIQETKKLLMEKLVLLEESFKNDYCTEKDQTKKLINLTKKLLTFINTSYE